MQSCKDFVCIFFVNVYSGQRVHFKDPFVSSYSPRGHGWHRSVDESKKVPRGHFTKIEENYEESINESRYAENATHRSHRKCASSERFLARRVPGNS